MKNFFLCFVSYLYTDFSCVWKKAAPITLPQADEIASIDITFEENTVSHSDKTWMSEIIADISSSEPTKRKAFKMPREWKVISRLTSGLRQERSRSSRMRTGVSTILNNLIKEFIKLSANCSKDYKKLIDFRLSYSFLAGFGGRPRLLSAAEQ